MLLQRSVYEERVQLIGGGSTALRADCEGEGDSGDETAAEVDTHQIVSLVNGTASWVEAEGTDGVGTVKK